MSLRIIYVRLYMALTRPNLEMLCIDRVSVL
jgi:hypothetical protein